MFVIKKNKTYGISLISQIPLRAMPDEKSEMTSQVLFGETYEIIESTKEWSKIRSFYDGYEGFINNKLVYGIEKELFFLINETSGYILKSIFNSLWHAYTGRIIITAGASLPSFNVKSNTCRIGDLEFLLEKPDIIIHSLLNESIIKVAELFLNSPYLWGGRTPLGIDCSGFTQLVFKIHGIYIPRDASQQVHHGIRVENVKDIKTGDLAFFSNAEGLITHTGILTKPGHIIHASGRVRVDKFDNEGIYNEESGCYTHNLYLIKRLI